MPKGGKLDRCHDKLEKEYQKRYGMDKEEASGKAWGTCRKLVKEEEEKKSENDRDNKDK